MPLNPSNRRRDRIPGLRRAVTTTSLITAFAVITSSCVGTTGRQVKATRTTTSAATETTIPEPDCAESLPPTAQAGQLLMVMVQSPTDATDLLDSGSVGGFGLKGRQPADVGDAVAVAVKNAPIQPFVASDEEGGTTQRLAAALGTLPSAKELADGTPQEAGQRLGAYAARMKDIGFNMVFGPVADTGSGSGLGTRSFGDDPEKVASYVTAIVGAIQAAGLIAVVKHWPGIGSGKTDPHDQLSALQPIDELRRSDLIPFRAAIAAGVGGVMVSHSIVPGLTGDDEPATISKSAITGELRSASDYKGLIITDSLGMGAIVATTPQDEAAEKAIAAGADIALVSGTDAAIAAHRRLTEAIRGNRLDPSQVERSVRRILKAKGISGPCPDIVANTTRTADRAQNSDSDSTDSDTRSSNSSDGGTAAGNKSSNDGGTNTNASTDASSKDHN